MRQVSVAVLPPFCKAELQSPAVHTLEGYNLNKLDSHGYKAALGFKAEVPTQAGPLV